MVWRLLFFAVAVSALVACSKGGTGSSADSSPLSPAHPAGSVSPAPAGQQAASLSPPPTGSSPSVPDTVKVDVKNRLIFVPNLGWLNEDQFWDIYYNEPQKLPGTIDLTELNKLGYREPQNGANSGANSGAGT